MKEITDEEPPEEDDYDEEEEEVKEDASKDELQISSPTASKIVIQIQGQFLAASVLKEGISNQFQVWSSATLVQLLFLFICILRRVNEERECTMYYVLEYWNT